MKTNSTAGNCTLALLLCVAGFLFPIASNMDAASGSAAIAINFAGGNTNMAASEVAGVVAQNNWNNANGASSSSPLSLVNQTGSLSGATVSWTSDNTWLSSSIVDQPGNARMMRGYLDTGNSHPTVVTVSNLSSGTYNIYVYADGDNGTSTRSATYQLSGPGITSSIIGLTDPPNTNFTGTFVQANNSNGNYVLFSNVPVSSGFTLTATPGQTSDIYPRAVVNGIQIVPVSQASPDFTLTVNPTSQTVNPGASTSYTATITPLNGFTGTVSLSASGFPNNASGSFNPVNTTASSTLTVITSTSTPSGTSTLTITGTSGSLSHSVTVTFVVGTPSGSAAIGVNFAGGNTNMAASEVAGVVAQNNWNNANGASSSSPLSLVNQTGSLSGATVSWTSDNTWLSSSIVDQPGNARMMRGYLDTGNSHPTVVAVSNLSSGTYNIYVYADGDNGTSTRSGTYQLSGPGITSSIIGLTDPPNTNFTGTFVQANNSNGNYVLFSNVPVGSGFTLTATPGQTSDIYPRAVVNGIQIVPVSQAPPDFTLTVNPTSQTVNPGASTSYTATITPLNGFTGTVTLGVTGLPSGATGTFTPATVDNTTRSSTLNISVGANTTASSYPLTISANSGSISRTADVTLIVSGGTGGGGGASSGLSGSFFIPTTLQNLTALGTADWAHWGLSSNTSFDHKTGVNSGISNYTVVNAEAGSVATSPYSSVAVSWSDGTPTSSVSSTQTSVYVAGLNKGFQITAVADTTPRLLTVYAGMNNTTAKMVAHLSDNSAPDYIDQSLQNSGPLAAAYTFVYSAASAGQTLTISWTAQQVLAYNSSVSLIAATLSIVSPSADFNMTAKPAVQGITPGAGTTYNLTIAPGSGFGQPLSLGVSGLPANATALFSPTSVISSGMPTLTVSTQPSTPPGEYSLTVTAQGTTASHSISLILNVFGPSGPYLAGSSSLPSGSVDLTAQGNVDWAHWGLTSAASFDHKAGVTQQISNFSVVGGQLSQVAQGSTPLLDSWTDGTPDATASGTNTGVYILGLNTGYQVTVPADTTARVLILYVGIFNTQGKVQAHLSDASSPDYIDTSLSSSGNIAGAYTLAYKAGSAGQTLTVTFTFNSMSGPRCSDTSGVHCSVLLQSATLTE